ncbi:hypothetical protein CVD28_04650 [Bacillus sp. M6-12]|uniref:hypothetical protein n=1 Tax=Bacillus sp. M6-12 TaxID=2054166 RepID=UPI000C7810EE|nr:hypothetical protein [Bacillus sp. M6-12]PLS19706.1 hypothetical protein CVD28_04650 [Bacillus sp. M6-12]
MIGRMYRPLKILNLNSFRKDKDKRGFKIFNKYKSNFGGTFKFETNIYLKYDAETQTEVVQVEFENLTLPIYMETAIRLDEDKAISSNEERTISSLRKLVRPTKITSKDILEFVMMIESSREETENDILEMSLVPVMKDNQEYMKIEVSCQTPVVIHSQTTLKIAE